MERITYQGRIIEVVEEEIVQGNTTKTFEYARRSPGTRLVIPKGDTILLTREFRSELGTYDYRLPGGKVFDTLKEYNEALAKGINILDAARTAAIKEAREETGSLVKGIDYLHTSVCGATVKWDLYYFIVRELDSGEQSLEKGEDISVEFFDREKVRAMCLDGSISEERSAMVLLRYLSTS